MVCVSSGYIPLPIFIVQWDSCGHKSLMAMGVMEDVEVFYIYLDLIQIIFSYFSIRKKPINYFPKSGWGGLIL